MARDFSSTNPASLVLSTDGIASAPPALVMAGQVFLSLVKSPQRLREGRWGLRYTGSLTPEMGLVTGGWP